MADPASLRVLIVEDDPAMVALIRKLLESAGYQNITVAESGADALARSGDTDLVLLDHQLPDLTGVELVPRLVGRSHPPSVIMVTGAGNESLAAAALRAGADDYVAKDRHLREFLPQIVERVRRHRALRSAQSAVEQELVRAERLAAIGEMTVTLHHELNNPLMAASAEVDLLAADPALTAGQRESVAAVRAALDRVGDIIRRAGKLRRAESHDYLTGLRMINLQAASDGTGVHRGRALLLIADEDVARLTSLLLRHSGFTVERCGSGAELTERAGRPDVALVVVSVIEGAGPEEGVGGFHPEAGRRYGVVALVSGDPAGARGAGADRVVGLPFDPATLATELIGAAESASTPGAPPTARQEA